MLRPVWWLLALLIIPALVYAGAIKHVKHKHWTKQYDHLFRKYSKHYFGPHVDWHWFKAQAIAESGLNPKAVSNAGAIGIMQILPSTYKDITKQNPFLADIREPRWNIAAGIFYDRYLYLKWKRKNELRNQDRLKFTFGSYNAGYGGVLKALRRAKKRHGEVSHWKQVEPFAPKETRGYVKRIQSLMRHAR